MTAISLSYILSLSGSLTAVNRFTGEGVIKTTMKKLLTNLIGKKFSVYVDGEFERMTDFLGFMKLLANYSDFFSYTTKEKYDFLYACNDSKYGYIDANIYVKIGR